MLASDDDADFQAANGSKLASLFDGAQPVDVEKATFTYAAPRQPKKGILKDDKLVSSLENLESKAAVNAKPANKLSIIIVKAVHTFLLEDGKYNPQGKLGAALLGDPAIHIYQLLLYKGKQQHITSTPVTASFQFAIQANNYSTFINAQGQNWSLHFENSFDCEEFSREVALARANCVPGCDGIQHMVTQVLWLPPGNEPAANIGDSMEVLYTVKTYSAGKLGDIIETNKDSKKSQRVKIRENVWEEGLIGASRETLKLILLPPSLLGPWKPKVPEGTSLAVEVEVMRLKQVNAATVSPLVTQSNMVDSTESAHDSSTDEHSIRARGASISEALTNSPKTHKASIISRMAKMGQATLPLRGAIPCNPSDSEETGDESSVVSAPTIVSKPTKSRPSKSRSTISHQSPSSAESLASASNLGQGVMTPHQVTLFQPAPMPWQQSQHGYSIVPTCSTPVYQSQSASVLSSPSSDISVFLSESRMHNTEVRMAVTKVADKVDLLLGKFDASQPSRPNYSESFLDSSTLLASVQKIVSENECLRTELADKREKLECQNERIFQLLNTNQKYLEKSQSSSADMESVVSSVKQDKEKLLSKLAQVEAQVEELKTKDSDSADMISSMQKQHDGLITELQGENGKLSSELAKAKAHIEELQRKDTDSQNTIVMLQKQLSEAGEKELLFSEQELQLGVLTAQLQEAINCSKIQEGTILQLRTAMQVMRASKNTLDEGLQVFTDQLDDKKREIEEQADIIKTQYISEIQKLQDENELLKSRYESFQRTTEISDCYLIVNEVKRVMNAVWRDLLTKFDDGLHYDASTVKEIVTSRIRDLAIQYAEMKTKESGLVSTEKVSAKEVVPKKEKYTHDSHGGTFKDKTNELSQVKNVDLVTHGPVVLEGKSSQGLDVKPTMAETTGNDVAKQKTVQPLTSVKIEKSPPAASSDDTDVWRPQPPTPPLFDDEEEENDWFM